jgi:ferric-dicitrate binding protein FerR (iron transport regulator)
MDETRHYTSWKDGKLVLRNDPMPNLLTRIERWYNVKFNVIDKSINEYTFWATFEEENLEQVLELLSLTGPIQFEKQPKVKLKDGTFKKQEIIVKIKSNYNTRKNSLNN